MDNGANCPGKAAAALPTSRAWMHAHVPPSKFEEVDLKSGKAGSSSNYCAKLGTPGRASRFVLDPALWKFWDEEMRCPRHGKDMQIAPAARWNNLSQRAVLLK